MVRLGILLFCFCAFCHQAAAWGFYAHRLINRKAVFLLPKPLFEFYQPRLPWLEKWATAPDERRYALKGEAERHYIDLDLWQSDDQLCPILTYPLENALLCIAEHHVNQHGIVPWNTYIFYRRLVDAFKIKDTDRIVRLTAELGHYIGDLHVPLHTTSNYNGQQTNQKGIHGLWETSIPELLYNENWVPYREPIYLEKVYNTIWRQVWISHSLVPTVLALELQLSSLQPNKVSYVLRKGQMGKRYAVQFVKDYQKLLGTMVQDRFASSVYLLSDFILTAWIDAGQPNLSTNSSR